MLFADETIILVSVEKILFASELRKVKIRFDEKKLAINFIHSKFMVFGNGGSTRVQINTV